MKALTYNLKKNCSRREFTPLLSFQFGLSQSTYKLTISMDIGISTMASTQHGTCPPYTYKHQVVLISLACLELLLRGLSRCLGRPDSWVIPAALVVTVTCKHHFNPCTIVNHYQQTPQSCPYFPRFLQQWIPPISISLFQLILLGSVAIP